MSVRVLSMWDLYSAKIMQVIWPVMYLVKCNEYVRQWLQWICAYVLRACEEYIALDCCVLEPSFGRTCGVFGREKTAI